MEPKQNDPQPGSGLENKSVKEKLGGQQNVDFSRRGNFKVTDERGEEFKVELILPKEASKDTPLPQPVENQNVRQATSFPAQKAEDPLSQGGVMDIRSKTEAGGLGDKEKLERQQNVDFSRRGNFKVTDERGEEFKSELILPKEASKDTPLPQPVENQNVTQATSFPAQKAEDPLSQRRVIDIRSKTEAGGLGDKEKKDGDQKGGEQEVGVEKERDLDEEIKTALKSIEDIINNDGCIEGFEDACRYKLNGAERADDYFEDKKNNLLYKINKNDYIDKLVGDFGYSNNRANATKIDKALNRFIWDQVVERYYRIRKEFNENKRKESLGGGVMNKGKEVLRSILHNRCVSWYLGLKPRERLLLNAGLAGGIVLVSGAGAMVALGYSGQRLARGAISTIVAPAVTGAISRSGVYSIDKINEEEKQKIEELENKNLNKKGYFDETTDVSKMVEDLERVRGGYEKKKRKAGLVKAAISVGAGVGAGFFSNLAIDSFFDSADQSGGSEATNQEQSKATSGTENKNSLQVQEASKKAENSAQPAPNKPAETPKVETSNITESIIEKHTVEKGDSLWNLLGKSLANNERFKTMTESQKTYVLSNLTNKVIENHNDFRVGEDGAVFVGKELNFQKLFENKDEAGKLFDKAISDVKAGSEIEKSIEKNNKILSDWVKNPENRGEVLTNEKVNELLTKKVESYDNDEIGRGSGGGEEEENEGGYEEGDGGGEKEGGDGRKEEEVKKPNEIDYDPLRKDLDEFREGLKEEKIEPSSPDYLFKKPDNTMLAGAGAVAGLSLVKKREEIQRGIEAAKNRLEQLQKTKREENRNPLERSLRADSKVAENEKVVKELATNTFLEGLDEIFGSPGLMGFGRKRGIDSKEWGIINGFSAKELVQYSKGGQWRAGLPQKMLEDLGSYKASKFIENIVDLRGQTEEVLDPWEEERVENYMVRLLTYLIKKKPLMFGDRLKKVA